MDFGQNTYAEMDSRISLKNYTANDYLLSTNYGNPGKIVTLTIANIDTNMLDRQISILVAQTRGGAVSGNVYLCHNFWIPWGSALVLGGRSAPLYLDPGTQSGDSTALSWNSSGEPNNVFQFAVDWWEADS